MIRVLLISLCVLNLCIYGFCQDSIKANIITQRTLKDTIKLIGEKNTSTSTSEYDTTFNQNNNFLKTWIPSITTLVVLLVSNLVVLYKIKKDTKEAIKKEIIITKIRISRECLEKFYDPIYTTLQTNNTIFSKFGPDSFPTDDGYLENEAASIWDEIVKNVILPNNRKICETIRIYSHLILIEDKIDNYINFIVHAESYEHFINFPNSLHKANKFPTNFIASVKEMRGIQLANLIRIENNLLI